MLKFILAVVFTGLFLSPSDLLAQQRRAPAAKSGQKNVQVKSNQAQKTKKKKEQPKNYNQQLIDAVKSNNLSLARTALFFGADINYVDSSGRSPMSYAWERLNLDNLEMMHLLVGGRQVSNPEKVNPKGLVRIKLETDEVVYFQRANLTLPSNQSEKQGCYMFRLIQEDQIDLLRKMLAQGADPNSRCGETNSPLLSLIAQQEENTTESQFARYIEGARALMASHADWLASDSLGNIPMHYAVAYYAPGGARNSAWTTSIIPLLLSAAANQKMYGRGVKFGNENGRWDPRTVQLLTQNKEGMTPLMLSIKNSGDPDYKLFRMLAPGVDKCRGNPYGASTSCLIDMQRVQGGINLYMMAAMRGFKPYCIVKKELNPSEVTQNKDRKRPRDFLPPADRDKKCEELSLN